MHHEDIYPRLRRAQFGTPRLREVELELSEEGDPLDIDVDEEISDARASVIGSLGAEEVVPVSEIMTRNVFCATPDMSLDALADVMLDQNISGAPVVDETGRPIGVISKTDILREIRELAEIDKATWVDWEQPRDKRAAAMGVKLDSLGIRTAFDAMTPIVYWLPEDASISQAAALMAYERVHRVPIVNKTGKVVGVVSTLDIMRWLASRKGYLIPR
jgi:CBS domain-containing protein